MVVENEIGLINTLSFVSLELQKRKNEYFQLFISGMYYESLSPGIPGENFKIPENPRPRGILKTGEISSPRFTYTPSTKNLKKELRYIRLICCPNF